MNRLPARVSSLLAAYALALQALLTAMVLPAQLANAPALGVICGTPGSNQPVDHDQAPCTLHCLLAAGNGMGVAPAGPGIAAFVAPASNWTSLPQARQTLGRATAKSPQLPRAPPLA